jgi:hypothetical protein
MEQPGVPLFSAAALAVLDRMPFDRSARGQFELMSGGLVWRDEFPKIGSDEWDLISPQWVYRYLIGYRRTLTLGEERPALKPVWDQVVLRAPNWPGLRPERRDERTARRLKAAIRINDSCLAQLEETIEKLDSDGD